VSSEREAFFLVWVTNNYFLLKNRSACVSRFFPGNGICGMRLLDCEFDRLKQERKIRNNFGAQRGAASALLCRDTVQRCYSFQLLTEFGYTSPHSSKMCNEFDQRYFRCACSTESYSKAIEAVESLWKIVAQRAWKK
jgi:hypothetical protein